MPNKDSLIGVDIDLYRERKNFHDRLKACVLTFAKWADRDSYCQPLFYNIIPFLGMNLHNADSTLLSLGFPAKKFRIKRLNPAYRKQLCLLNSLYYIIQVYWGYLKRKVSSVHLNHCINYLEGVAKKGLDSTEVIGNVRTGWRLK